MADEDNQKNVVNLAEARKRQRTVRAGANGKAPQASQPKGRRKIWVYVQFLLFLGVLAYMMQLCRGPA